MRRHRLAALLIAVLAMLATALPAAADTQQQQDSPLDRADLEAAHGDSEARLAARDALATEAVTGANYTKEIVVIGRGERLELDATTDVWALGGYAYTGTFQSPCGGEPGAGVWVWDITNKGNPVNVGVIPSPVGSRSNDVKAANMNSGAILVHSNEACDGGPGGFEIYNVNDPLNPVHLASVQTDELNPVSDSLFGGLTDVGVHNLFLFRQGRQDYVAAVVESAFDNFRIYNITDPANPVLASAWGAEELFDPGVGDLTDPNDPDQVARALDAVLWLLDGFGASANRFLHDVTIQSRKAYLSNWDAGLVLMDIADVSNPAVVSVAIDPTLEDGEVNSHAAWPSHDGSIVVENEEDFSPFASVFTIDTGPAAGEYPAAEGAITPPIALLPGGVLTGPTTYVGFACDPGNPGFDDPVPAGTGIALIQRGACTFSSKINNAEAAGYSGVVVFNDEARGDALVSMGGSAVNLPGVFVGHSTGLAIAGVASAADLVIGAGGETVSATTTPDGWGGYRVWDYSNPQNPVLASVINTTCSADPLDPSCDPVGTYSSHNVVVETKGGKTLAYLSWYWEGVLVYDVTDPYNPVEVARYSDDSAAFMAQNGGPQDVWGIYKNPHSPWIYASDRNGGLYILRLRG